MTLAFFRAAEADADRDGIMRLILQNLLKEPGYAALYKWEPRNKTIVAAQTRIVAWILHPEHIHMFKDNESIKDVRGQVPLGYYASRGIFRVFLYEKFDTGEGRFVVGSAENDKSFCQIPFGSRQSTQPALLNM